MAAPADDLMIRVLVSACLLGERVRYHGGDAACADPLLARWQQEGRLIPFCPEVAGGLPVPRPAAELRGGDGAAVLRGEAQVQDVEGRDLSAAFLTGARGALESALRHGARLAILKEGSPSCGTHVVYDGSFSGVRTQGRGVTAALLLASGIQVFDESELPAAAACLRELEAGGAGVPR